MAAEDNFSTKVFENNKNPDGENIVILVADDDPGQHIYLNKILGLCKKHCASITVIHKKDAEEAIAYLDSDMENGKKVSTTVDFVISDFEMDGNDIDNTKNGKALLEFLNTDEEMQSKPRLLRTGCTEEAEVQRQKIAEDNGASFLKKASLGILDEKKFVETFISGIIESKITKKAAIEEDSMANTQALLQEGNSIETGTPGTR